MAKRFKGSPDTWQQYSTFLLEAGKADEARAVLQRSLKSLPKRHHLPTIVRFATAEYKYGSAERARTMFEGIVSNYPKRLDLWNVYVDKEVQAGNVEGARRLLDRLISMRFSTKKMKFLFKKFMELEQRHGDETRVEYVKQRAIEYVSSLSAVAQ